MIRILTRIVGRLLTHPKIDSRMRRYLLAALKVLFYIITVLIVADTLGIPMTSLLALFSVLGLAVSLASGCTNIVMDYVLIALCDMGIAGAAYATGIGQCVTLAVYLLFYVLRPIPVRLGRKYMVFEAGIVKKLYSVGISATLNLALPSLLITVLNGLLAGFSEKYVLVLGVYYKLQTFIYLTANGIIQGIRPLLGYNYGAGEYGRVRRIYRTALAMNMGIMLAGTVVSWLMPEALIGLFTDSPDTIGIGGTALRIISLGFVLSACSVTCCGALEGLGRGGQSLAISLLRYGAVIIPAAYLFTAFLGADGVWWAFCFTEWVTAGCAVLIYRRLRLEQG